MIKNQDSKAIYEKSKSYLNQEVQVEDLDDIRELLKFHEWRYYVKNDPIVSDFEYDQLYKKLEQLEHDHPELVTQDSPTQRVASDLNENFEPVAHTIPMLSLGNSYNADDLNDFDRQVKKLCGLDTDSNVEYTLEPKFDGGSIALVYEDDYLSRGATRGNGIMGEEMTPNAKAIPSVPLKAKFSELGIAKAELRGEALIRKDNFNAINQERSKEGLALFANPRNAATGGLRMKDPNETRKRELEVFIFQLGYAVDKDGNDVLNSFKTHSGSLSKLEEIGFKIAEKESTVVPSIKEAIAFCEEWEAKREGYDYEIDGMVIKVNSFELQEKCGYTQHHPRWAIAFKFKAKQATTKLVAVEYQVGKVGSITPVAKVEPVHIAGVTVSSVSLHNEEFIRAKDLRLGDMVVVERAGDVIPYIVKPLEDLRDGKEVQIVFPKICPINETDIEVELIKEGTEAAWRCPNCVCGAQDLQKIAFHVSKVAMDIDGFGKSYGEKFYDLGWLKDISDVYNLDYDKIAALEGFGTRSAENLKNAIDKAKKNPIQRLLHSLSIHHLGKKASKIIAEQINYVLDLQEWTIEDFTSLKDIGPVVAQNVMAYFQVERNINMLRRMEEYGVNMHQTEEDKPLEIKEDAVFLGKTILFTGTLQRMKRKEAQELAEANGAKNISAVSSNLDILVVGEKAGSKLKKAEALGSVKIMTEDEFLSEIEK